METKRKRGRPREFAGQFNVHLTDEQLAYAEAEANRDDRPLSAVLRRLVGEAIERRQKQGR
jgi:hypothetical protein